MLALAELDLPYLAMETAEFAADPFPHFEAARDKHPWLAVWTFGHIITEYRAMRELFGQDDKLRPSNDGVVEQLGAKDTLWGQWANEHLLMAAPEQHRRVRDIFAPSFTPRHVNELRPQIRASVTRLLDEWTPKGEFDFEEFASWFPISVMFIMLDAPIGKIGAIKDDLEVMGLAFSMDSSLLPRLDEAILRLEEFVRELIDAAGADQQSGPRSALLDAAVAACEAGEMTSRELSSNLIAMLMGAYDTTKNVLTLIMHLIIERPEIYQRCADDHDYCRRVVEAHRDAGPSLSRCPDPRGHHAVLSFQHRRARSRELSRWRKLRSGSDR